MVGIKMKDMVFRNLAITKDYQQIAKWYRIYEKGKGKGNVKGMQQMKEKILALLPEAKKDFERVYTTYSAAQKELEASKEPSVLYAPSQSKSYLDQLTAIKIDLETIEKVLEEDAKPPQQAQPPTPLIQQTQEPPQQPQG